MTAPTLHDLEARVKALKAAPMFSKAALAEQALTDFLQYLAAQEARIYELERMVFNGAE